MKIIFQHPCEFCLDILALEDRDATAAVQVTLKTSSFESESVHRLKFHMECAQLRLFQQDLQALPLASWAQAQLQNLDGTFKLQLSRRQALEYQMCISWAETKWDFRKQYGEFKQVYIMDEEALYAVIQAFEEVSYWFA